MAYTINVLVRAGLRLSAADYSDNDVNNKIEQALAFVNKVTKESKTITTYSAANTDSVSYDELISLAALWAIFLEVYMTTVTRGDGKGNARHISSLYQDQFMLKLSAQYPGLVEMKSGVLVFKDQAYANTDVGYTDNRFMSVAAVYFDLSPDSKFNLEE